MIDARNVYRKVTRKFFDFSPEQLANLTAIVWLYRGRTDRYLSLVKDYFATMREECARIPAALACFEEKLHGIRELFHSFSLSVQNIEDFEPERKQPLAKAITELQDSIDAYETDRKSTVNDVGRFYDSLVVNLPSTNDQQHATRKSFEVIAAELKGIVKQIDLLDKLAIRFSDLSNELATDDRVAELYERRTVNKFVKQLDEQRKNAVEQLKLAIYFHRQIIWLQDHFPEAQLVDVPGLIKLVDRSKIEAADWSLSPGRYVGVAPQDPDEDFDFEATLRDIHLELAGLNDEAIKLAETIQRNFEDLGI